MVAIRDPIRPEVFPAIEKCKNAGIRIIMATGDHVETAKSYAIELNIMNSNDKAYSHSEIEKMSDDELKEILKRVNVFARINPEDKYRIVTLLKEMGEIVAMTGDGVNDAPALRKADIGIAMGLRGTDLAREVSALVLLDDNFASIVNAIEEGRVIYDNIKNSIFFLLSCNFGEIMLVLASMILSMGLPLGPLHLLWLNLVTDSFPALALGFEKPNKNIMKPRIKKDNDIMNLNFICKILFQGIIIAGGSFALYSYFYFKNSSLASTVCFAGIIVIELLRVLSARSKNDSIIKLGIFSNMSIIYSIIISFLLLLLALYGPVAKLLFDSSFIDYKTWIIILCVSILILLLAEVEKIVFIKKKNN